MADPKGPSVNNSGNAGKSTQVLKTEEKPEIKSEAAVSSASYNSAIPSSSWNNTKVLDINAQLPSLFDGSGSWKIWKTKLFLYFEIKNLTSSEKQKRSILLSLLSEKILDDVFGEFGDAVVQSTSYADILAYLDRLYDQSKNLASNRHDFHRLSEAEEGPLKFLRDLKNKSLTCDFRSIKDFVDYSITMVYTSGVKDANLRFLLLKEPNLTASKAEEITRQYLSTTEAVCNLGNMGKRVKIGGEVHSVSENETHYPKRQEREEPFDIHHISGNNPSRRYKNNAIRALKVCFKCRRPGHMAENCLGQF